MIPCTRCQSPQLPNTLFCDVCGEALILVPEDSSAPPPQEAPIPLRCEFPERRQVVMLPTRPEIVFGRGDTRSGVLPDIDLTELGGREGGVSRLHARLIRQGALLYLEDLGSMNGTFVNERQLTPHTRTSIQPGDKVRLGLLPLIFQPANSRS
jgi:hypothetical protein